MEALRQGLRIAAALFVVVIAALIAMPERPSLFSVRGHAPADTAERVEPEGTAPTEPNAPAQAGEMAAEIAEAQPQETGGGTSHLQRLREASGPSPAAPPIDALGAREPQASAPQSPPPAAPEQPSPPPAAQSSEASRSTFRLFRDPVMRDAATLVTEDQIVTVAGLTPPERGALCARGLTCTDAMRAALREWLDGRDILCAVPAGSAPRVEAACLAGEDDLGEWLVSQGWAQAANERYGAAEAAARRAGLGLWAGNR